MSCARKDRSETSGPHRWSPHLGDSDENVMTTKVALAEREDERVPTPRAVLAPELAENRISLREAWVGTLRDKRDVSLAVRSLGQILPGMSHLKRCFGKRLVLTFVAPEETPAPTERDYYAMRLQLEQLLTSNGFDLSIFQEEFEIERVPAVQQRTKAQARLASAIWPLNFHPDPRLERILNGHWFDTGDLGAIELCMGACIEAASRQAHGNDECNGSAIVFDPIENKIVAVAAARMDIHPMWHAAILAIDLVAALTGETGGAYGLLQPDFRRSVETESCDFGISTSSATRQRTRQRFSVEPRINANLVAFPKDLVDLVDRYAPRAILKNPERGEKSCRGSGGSATTTGYLCTDYWIFLLREPCPLCAMALLHSRVGNVFYGVANEHRGVLGSRALLHTTPGLNHRYRVWRGIREEECRRTFREISSRVFVGNK